MNQTVEAVSGVRAPKGTFWMFVPVVLLVASVVGVGSMASIAARDPGFALEQNYYDRAVHWDRQQAEWAEDARLGYRLSLSVPPAESGLDLVVRVADRTGAVLHAARVDVEAFAIARSAEHRTLELSQAPDGSYRAPLVNARPGLWEFRCAVTLGGERYTESVRAEVPRSALP
jgi:hypothetical protein